jgi:hypothetical protein
MSKPIAALGMTLFLATTASMAAPTPAEQEFREIVYRFGKGYTQAAIDLATPSKVKASKAEEGMTRKEFQAAGVQVTWLESPEMTGKPVPIDLRLTRKGHVVNDIFIGASSPADVRSQLGAPDDSGNHWMAYRGLAEICEDRFTFRFAGGKLSEVQWQWCAD